MSFERRFLGDEERFDPPCNIPDDVLFPINQVLHGDCLDLIYDLPEHSVDLVLTDPPYNIGESSKITQVKGKPVRTDKAWGTTFKDSFTDDEYGELMSELCDAFDYVLKPDGSILMFFDRGKPYYLRPFYEQFHFRNMIVFVKKNPAPHYVKNNYRSTFEQCAWFSREKYKINFISQRKMKNVFIGLSGNLLGNQFKPKSSAKKTEHPTEKFEWMIYPLVERHSNKGDVILDPMCGSGTTLICAKKLGRKYIGMDIDERWCHATTRRLNEHPESLDDFAVPPKQR